MSSNPPNPEQQIQQVINDVNKDAQLAKPGAFPLEVAIPDTPNVFRGATPQEVLDQLVRAQSESFKALQSERQRIAELQTQVTTLQQQQVKPEPVNDHAIKVQERYNLWAKNPTEATKQDLAELLGVPADRVIDVMKKAIEGTTVQTAAQEFIARTPGYPVDDPQVATLMRQRLQQKYGMGMDAATADNLIVVYHDLVNEGRISPAPIPTSGITNGNAPLPHVRGGSAPANPVNDVLSNFRNLSLDQMKEAINRLSAQAQAR